MPKPPEELEADLKTLHSQYKDLDDHLKRIHKYYDFAQKNSSQFTYQQKAAFQAKASAEAAAILKQYGNEFSDSLERFFAGPEADDDESVQKWITQNYVAARLFTSSEFLSACPFLETDRVERQMHGAARMVRLYFEKHRPDLICWGNNTPEEISDTDYRKWMPDNRKDLQTDYETFREADAEPFNVLRARLSEYAPAVAANAPSAPAATVSEQAAAKPAKRDPYREDKARLDAFAAKLEKAQTTFGNSDQYKQIFNTIKLLNRTEYPQLPGYPKQNEMSPEKNHAMKLFAIRNMINAYLTHKGKDGVKPNVYSKLAAVEELNQFVCSRIQELDLEPFDFGKGHFDRADAPVTYLDEALKQPKHEFLDYSEEEVRSRFPGTDKDPAIAEKRSEYRNAMDCMGRIILNAEQNGRSEARIGDLKNMHQAFRNAPGANSGPAAPENSRLAQNALKAMQKRDQMLVIHNKQIVEATERIEPEYRYSKQDATYYRFVRNYVSLSGDDKHYYDDWLKTGHKAIMRANDMELTNRGDHFTLDNFFSACRFAAEHYIAAHMDDFTKLADKKLTDSQLIDQWPELSVKLGCFKGAFSKEYDTKPEIRKIIDRYDQMEARMNELAAPARKKESSQRSL